MKKITIASVVFSFLLLCIWSCNKAPSTVYAQRIPVLPATLYNYVDTSQSSQSSNIPWGGGFSIDNTPANNQTTNAGATLGRVLFYEKLLSLDNNRACGSCHKQQYAFADNVAFSSGFMGGKTARNSLPVFNQKMNESFFWDGRAATLEQQSTMPVQNHVEMGMENLNNIAPKLNKAGYYGPLFTQAFGSPDITAERISDALAQFMRSIKSSHSKFDIGSTSNFSNFTTAENDGMSFFTKFRCANCHAGQNLSGSGEDWANIGLDINYTDPGRAAITGFPSDNGVFKIPSLRNIALTAPYMHDGRYATLYDVLNHYNNIQPNANLDFRLTDEGWGSSGSIAPHAFNMSEYQKAAIIAFLNTLTDEQLIADPRFSDPFTK